MNLSRNSTARDTAKFKASLRHFHSSQLADIPPHLLPLVILDEWFASQRGNAAPTSTISYSDAIRALKGHKVVSILGGSNLGTPGCQSEFIFESLNRVLAAELYQLGWSVASGGGRGKAMEELQACSRSERNATYPRNCLNVVVASELNDERLHSHADFTIRSPGGHISTREQMILGLSQVALFYPGHIGTLAEFFEAALQNYCSARGPFHYSPPIVILVSCMNDDEEAERDTDEHYFSPLIKQVLEAPKKYALTKGESYQWLHQIILPSPHTMQRMTSPERVSVLKPFANKIIKIMETHISSKYGDTLNAGFGKGIDLRRHYFGDSEGI